MDLELKVGKGYHCRNRVVDHLRSWVSLGHMSSSQALPDRVHKELPCHSLFVQIPLSLGLLILEKSQYRSRIDAALVALTDLSSSRPCLDQIHWMEVWDVRIRLEVQYNRRRDPQPWGHSHPLLIESFFPSHHLFPLLSQYWVLFDLKASLRLMACAPHRQLGGSCSQSSQR